MDPEEDLRKYLLDLEATGKFDLAPGVPTKEWNRILLQLFRGEDLRLCFFQRFEFILNSQQKFKELLFPIELPFPRLVIKYQGLPKIATYDAKTIGEAYEIINNRKKGAVIKVEGWPVPRPAFSNTKKRQRSVGIKVTIKQTEFWLSLGAPKN